MSLECSICSNTLLSKSLPCGHSFHCSCIDQWSDSKSTCPICRAMFDPSATRRSKPTETVECYVCLDNIDVCRVLVCGHEFHEPCVNPKLVEANKCPQCSMYCGIDEELDLSLCNFCDEPVMDHETTLPCGHTFHQPCVAAWLLENNTCPECLTSTDGSSVADICSKFCKSFSEITTENEVVFVCEHRFHRSCSQGWDVCPTCSGDTSEKQQDVCMFCTLRISREETCLPCGHKFHESCVAPWQREQKMCPDCLRPCEPPAFLDEARAIDTTEKVLCLLCSETILGNELELFCGHMFHRLCFESWQGDSKKCPECLLPCDEMFLTGFSLALPRDYLTRESSPPVMNAFVVESSPADALDDPNATCSEDSSIEIASEIVPIEAGVSGRQEPFHSGPTENIPSAEIANTATHASNSSNTSISEHSSVENSPVAGTSLPGHQETLSAPSTAEIANTPTGASNSTNTPISEHSSVEISPVGGTSLPGHQETLSAPSTAKIANTPTGASNSTNTPISEHSSVEISPVGVTALPSSQEILTAEIGNSLTLTASCSYPIENPDNNITNSRDTNTCLVCLLGISNDQLLLPCGHMFHKACITTLLDQ